MATGGLNPDKGAPTTPGRNQQIALGVDDTISVKQPWGQIVFFDQSQQSIDAKAIGCSLIPKTGWQLTPVAFDLSAIHELYTAQSFILKPTTVGGANAILQVPSGIQFKNVNRLPTELTGATTGASSDAADTSDPFLYRNISAGQDWRSVNLTADQANYPDLDNTSTFGKFSPNLPLVRCCRTTTNHDGAQPFMFRFYVPQAKTSQKDVLFILYFCGPASDGPFTQGDGRYAMVLKGDGTFTLWESYPSDTQQFAWQLVMEDQRYAPAGQVAGTHHRIMVFPFTRRSPRSGYGGGISFLTTVADKFAGEVSGTTELFRGKPKGSVIHYDTPTPLRGKHGTGHSDPMILPMPLRVSQRADLRSAFQLSYLGVKTQGLFINSPVIIPGRLAPTSSIEVQWYGDLPAATAISCQLFDASFLTNGDPSKLSVVGNTATSSSLFVAQGKVWGGRFIFTPTTTVSGLSSVYNLRTILSNTGAATGATQTPTVTQHRWIVDGISASSGDSPFTINYPAAITEVSITGADADPTQETAAFSIADPGALYGQLNTRGHFATRITVTDSSPATSVVFDGYTVQIPAHREGSRMPVGLGSAVTASFPASSWRSYKVTCLGKWKRLAETVAAFNWDFSVDPSTSVADTPPYAVEVIQLLLGFAGFSGAQVDIGVGSTSSASAFPIRLFPKGQDGGLVLTAGRDVIGDFCRNIARDYLGAALVWDANAINPSYWTGDISDVQGCWRLIHPALPPYKSLAAFVTTGPDLGSSALPHMLPAYSVGTGSNGQRIPKVPIFRGSLDTFVSPAEVNRVIVTGTGDVSTAANKTSQLQLTMDAVNVDSYDFNGISTADPTSPDFIGYEKIGYKVDRMGLTSEAAVRWVLRRTYDLTAHAYKHVTFTAPLVLVTNVADPAQKRPRPLRFYDPVTVDGQQFLVRSCSPFWISTDHMLAHYELISVPPAYCVPDDLAR